mmetsp:Transcript_106730/g.340728  ORF Transcript_106730/g.340728 Transcript_106730/m.340728 type:complete len:206 (-) Transcript_106730:192-809(-)
MARGPKPCSNVRRIWIPFGGKSATPLRVEPRTHGIHRSLLRATLIVPLALSIHVTIVSFQAGCRAEIPLAGEVLADIDVLLVAVVVGVQGRAGRCVPVRALDDVVLAPAGPDVLRVLAVHPEGRPRAATGRNVVDLCNEQALVIHVLRLDPDRGPAAFARHVHGVRGHVSVGGGLPDEACRLRGLLRNVVHVALRWVGRVPEGEL